MKIVLKIFPFLTILALILIFFGQTLTGAKIFATPDFGQSDILHNEYANKFFMSQTLKNNQLPLWNPQIGTGFPQIGFPSGLFNPINLALFYFFPMPQAYNIGLATIFFTTAIFTYLYARSLRLSETSSLFAAVVFTFSGFFITQIVHYSVIQTLSLFPTLLYLTELYLQKRKLYLIPIISLAVGLQILTGFFQVIVYSLIVLILYIIFRTLFIKEKIQFKIIFTLLFLIAISFSFLIAAAQLLPSWEFTQISNRQGGISNAEIKLFPYPLKHIVTFVWPYLLGDPRVGTYPKFSANWGIFWENTGYVGIIPIILAIFAILSLIRKNIIVIFFFALLIISLLLMVGKNSPTFFLYSVPPLSLFRVPARWIIFFTFSLSILSAIGFEVVFSKMSSKIATARIINFFYLIVIIISIINIFIFAKNYHLVVTTPHWLKPPQTASFLKNDRSSYRVFTLGNEEIWNKQFLNGGWQKNQENYINFLEGLNPNLNTIFNINQLKSYGILVTKRYVSISNILDNEIKEERKRYTLSNTAKKILDMENVKYIISPYAILGNDLDLVFQSQTEIPYYIYENKTVLPPVFTVAGFEFAPTFKEQQKIISSSFNPQNSVILEKNLKDKKFKEAPSQTKITRYENQKVEIEAKMPESGILVLTDAYYPGWKATIDGKESPIIAANINQRALILEKGDHVVEFSYQPESFKKGAIISLASLTFTIVVFVITVFIERRKDTLEV